MTESQKVEGKIRKAKEKHEELNDINWSEILNRNPDVLESFLGGVVRDDNKRKKSIERRYGLEKLFELESYSEDTEPFVTVFARLTRNESIRQTAKVIDVSPAHVYNLKQGKTHPTIEVMEMIADRYSKKPAIFLEYKVYKIMSSFHIYLYENPEVVDTWYNRLPQEIRIR